MDKTNYYVVYVAMCCAVVRCAITVLLAGSKDCLEASRWGVENAVSKCAVRVENSVLK